ncbi:MAG TPA: hypothetical protein DCF71_03830, partial [Gemmatimonadetes bacterium]|nr:hypothetical protein [Gemmatimonadota bacterium]
MADIDHSSDPHQYHQARSEPEPVRRRVPAQTAMPSRIVHGAAWLASCSPRLGGGGKAPGGGGRRGGR